MIEYRTAAAQDAPAIADLAREIWTEHYESLIGIQQVEYMLEMFQSAPAITAAIKGATLYSLALQDGTILVGYMALKPEEGYLYLSKLYVKKSHRGLGIAREFFRLAAAFAYERGLPTIRLNVNRGNEESIAAYRHIGFHVVLETVADIGGGYVMDDYIMEWKL